MWCWTPMTEAKILISLPISLWPWDSYVISFIKIIWWLISKKHKGKCIVEMILFPWLSHKSLSPHWSELQWSVSYLVSPPFSLLKIANGAVSTGSHTRLFSRPKSEPLQMEGDASKEHGPWTSSLTRAGGTPSSQSSSAVFLGPSSEFSCHKTIWFLKPPMSFEHFAIFQVPALGSHRLGGCPSSCALDGHELCLSSGFILHWPQDLGKWSCVYKPYIFYPHIFD